MLIYYIVWLIYITRLIPIILFIFIIFKLISNLCNESSMIHGYYDIIIKLYSNNNNDK